MQLSDDEFEAVVDEAIQSIPEGFHHYLQDIAIDIEDMPTSEECKDAGVKDPRALMALYRGTPLTRRHVDTPYRYPERIIIFKKNLERISRNKRQMIQQIHTTVLHEVGHHFGLNEQQLRELGYG